MSHNADLTYLHRTDAMDTAAVTYETLLGYLKANPSVAVNPPAKFDDLKGLIVGFAKADTKATKREWFEKQGFQGDLGFIAKTSLWAWWPFHPDAFSGKILRAETKQCPSDDDPKAIVDAFLTTWIIKKDWGSALGCLDLENVAETISRKSGHGALAREVILANLQGWLLADHSKMSALGHGQPSAEGFRTLQTEAPQAELIQAGTLDQAITTSIPGVPYLFNPIGQPATHYGVVFQFKHAPADVVLLLVGQKDNHWKVEKMTSVVIY